MGVVPQIDNLDTELTVEQNLMMFAVLYRVPRRERRAAVERALGIAQLLDRRSSKVTELSGGMKRRLLIARGLVHHPELVLLDEPTVGLDPQVRQELWSLIDALRSQGTTVLMSTHYIEEAERLADDVAVMAHGAVVARGTPHDLRVKHVGERATEYYGSPEKLAAIERIAQTAGLATRRTGPSIAVLRSEDGTGERARRARDAGRKRSPHRHPRGRLRPAHRRGAGVSAAVPKPRGARGDTSGPPSRASGPVEFTLFKRYWLSSTTSSVVQPIIYLLAFGLGVGTLVATVDGISYVEFVGTGSVATAVLFASAFPGMFNTYVAARLPAHLRRTAGRSGQRRRARPR